MAEFTLRAGTKEDAPAIRSLIRRVGINPTGLDWRRFVLAVDSSDRILGCGQLKPHGKHMMELASIAVEPEFQEQGIARAIIEYLITRAPRPLYLTCRAKLGAFYGKWGFHAIPQDQMPPYYRRLARLAVLLAPLLDDEGGGLLVMQLE